MKLASHRARRFLTVLIGTVAVPVATAVPFNAYVDPLWMFPAFGDRASLRYCVDDERQSKVNKMVYGGAGADSVIIGSSRTEVFDPRYFQNEHVINIAMNGMRPVELSAYLKIYARHVGIPKTVYVGLDFWGYLYAEGEDVRTSAPDKERLALSPTYRINSVLDLGLLWKSVDTISVCSSEQHRPRHTYDGVEEITLPYPWEQEIVKAQLVDFEKSYKPSVPPDPIFKAHLRAIREAVPGAVIRPFIPPERADLHRVLIETRGRHDYDDWIAAIVDEFGSVVQFGGINSFTENYANFYDTNHLYSRLTNRMIGILEGRVAPDSDGFGRTIVKSSPER